MSRLVWSESGKRYFEVGVDRGVFFSPDTRQGVAWNGLVSVKAAPSGTGVVPQYVDGEKYFVETTADTISGSIEAFTYPFEFEPYDGRDERPWVHQAIVRRPFSLSYRSLTVNDLGQEIHTIHLIYNMIVEPTEASYTSLGDELDPTIFSWNFRTLPEYVPGMKPTAHLMFSTRGIHSQVFKALEDVLYGTETTTPRLPSPPEALDVFEENAVLRIIDHGDGTWTAIGPDDVVQLVDDLFTISWPSAKYLNEDTYTVRSL